MDNFNNIEELPEEKWQKIEELLESEKKSCVGRKPKHSKRSLIKAIFYHLNKGCSWRKLPKDFPPWKTVASQLRRWQQNGIFTKLLALII